MNFRFIRSGSRYSISVGFLATGAFAMLSATGLCRRGGVAGVVDGATDVSAVVG